MNFIKRSILASALFLALNHSAIAQFNWGQSYLYPYPIGGDSSREAVTATLFNNVVYMAYTSRTAYPGGDYYMYIATSTDGLHYSAPVQINTQSGPAHASSNPSLTVYQNNLYLAYNTASGVANVINSANGTTWGSVQQLPSPAVDYSPSITTDGQTLYVGLRNRSTFTLEMCTYRLGSGTGYTCSAPGGLQMNFSPGLTYYAGTVYVAFEYRGDSHVLYYYVYSPTTGLSSLFTSASGDSTSAAPTLVKFQNSLIMGFRANDGGHGFYTKRDQGDTSWSKSQYSGFSIGGAPALVTGLPNESGYLYCLYSANDSSHYMYAAAGFGQ